MKPTVKALRALGFKMLDAPRIGYYIRKFDTGEGDHTYLVVDIVAEEILIANAMRWQDAVVVLNKATMADVARWANSGDAP